MIQKHEQFGEMSEKEHFEGEDSQSNHYTMLFSINLVHILSCEKNNYFIFLLLYKLVTDNLELSHYLKGKSYILFSGNFLDFKPRRQCLK